MAVIAITKSAAGGVTIDDDTSLPFSVNGPVSIEEFGTNQVRISAGNKQREFAVTDTFTINGVAYVPGTVAALQAKLRDEVFNTAEAGTLRILAAASTNLTTVKASPGQVYTIDLYNISAAAKYLKLYNKAANPTLASDTPKMTIPIGAASGRFLSFPNGLEFSTGIALAITGAVGDTDTTALVANDVVVNISFG